MISCEKNQPASCSHAANPNYFSCYIHNAVVAQKGGVEFDPQKVTVENMPQYCSLCAWALALSHAKSGDAAKISGYAGNGDELGDAMVRFAVEYADQTEKDHQALKAAAKSGRIKVADKAA